MSQAAELRAEIEEYCEQIRKWFSDRVAITVFVRNLKVTDGSRDVLVTSDDADEIGPAIARLMKEGKPR